MLDHCCGADVLYALPVRVRVCIEYSTIGILACMHLVIFYITILKIDSRLYITVIIKLQTVMSGQHFKILQQLSNHGNNQGGGQVRRC